MEILRIKSADTYPIRQLVLRPNGKIEDCHFKGDSEEQTFHLGAFVDKRLVSIASFYFEQHPFFMNPYQYRLRGMATIPEFQGKGMSSALLQSAFPMIKQNQCGLLWCNARQTAVGFYQKVGFTTSGEIFEMPEIGPHILMSIKIE
jgi:GNAT superfamily N-acetyltransferase